MNELDLRYYLARVEPFPNDREILLKFWQSNQRKDKTIQDYHVYLKKIYDWARIHHNHAQSLRALILLDWKAYFEYLNTQDISLIHRYGCRKYVKTFLIFLLKEDIEQQMQKQPDQAINLEQQFAEKLGFVKYLFSDAFFKFQRRGGKKRVKAYFEKQDVGKILFWFKTHTTMRDYLIVSLLAHCGCRRAGLCHISLGNIHLNHRYFYTDEKETEGNKGIKNLYCLPNDPGLLNALEIFLDQTNKTNMNVKANPESRPSDFTRDLITLSDDRLFPLNPATINYILKKYPMQDLGHTGHLTPQNFRDKLNGFRDEKAKTTLKIRENNPIQRDLKILLNQSDGDVNTDHYLSIYQQPVKRVALYDLYHPY